MENTTFQSVLEQVVLAQNPELFIYAQKLSKGMINTPKYVIIRAYKDSFFFPEAPEGYKFKDPNSMAYVRVPVMNHNLISNELLLEDGTWVANKDQNTSESSWIYDVVPIEEPKKELTPQLGYTTEEDIF